MEKRLTMIFAALFLCIGMALAQTKVSGIVTSAEDGEPVVGASVKVVGTNTGTVTNINGQFQLQIADGAKLEISYIGMQTKTVKATPKMKIVLDPDNQSLNEVMVVAFGTAKKSAFTGSAAVVDAKELSKKVTTKRGREPRRIGCRSAAPWTVWPAWHLCRAGRRPLFRYKDSWYRLNVCFYQTSGHR